jgi:hypothetical protein
MVEIRVLTPEEADALGIPRVSVVIGPAPVRKKGQSGGQDNRARRQALRPDLQGGSADLLPALEEPAAETASTAPC